MKILMVSTPATGHINPLLAVAQVLIDEGHEVVCLSGTWMREKIESAGARFRALQPGADLDLRDILAVAPELAELNSQALLQYLYFGYVHRARSP